MKDIVSMLLGSSDPSIRYKTRVNVLGENPDSKEILRLQDEIKQSDRVKCILSKRNADGLLEPTDNPYKKWDGAHWALALLADIGYPKNDLKLQRSLDQVVDFWLQPEYYYDDAINGRYRRHASQQGNALFSALRLFDGESGKASALAHLLLKWQWPDGGWNCDQKPEADSSSFMESLIPLRGLVLYAQRTGDEQSAVACRRAAEVFLSRTLYRSRSAGRIIKSEFIKLHYPCYWHYDILFGLKVMAEAGYISDPRCQDALDLLESKRLPDGGWPAEAKYGRTIDAATAKRSSNSTYVTWGEVNQKVMNEWVTVDALYVLSAAGRMNR
ncbi:terpenoid cyclases/protein prenyltransferase alpha-alpha toroid [Trichococcus palustris]|uniref:Terpenoid cyclases/protein prenyltransferase alpha-alpha toroid n=1 Tax=Trichococcus palustris TaxID=140314 RepID=A0A143YEG3_9LACT|nr:hypothetical protein [Trichococcus palustris]CZQ86558.1 terpenoid cyclases/protein prenyltransferase alpha-alpha toroid [Trichococcus palustris]SFK81139.1 hypothetical protein SAMN04488076_105175 [Trichococcus palustris]